jgi:hypothetical protein
MRQSRRPAPISSVPRNLNCNCKLQKVSAVYDLAKHCINKRYAKSVINDPANFDAIEIHDISELSDPVGDAFYEPDCEQYPASSYSVYAHLLEGGIDCCGDFTRREDAQAYGKELSEKYGWPVNDFSTSPLQTESFVRRQKALLEMALALRTGFREAVCHLDPSNSSDYSLALYVRLIYIDALAQIFQRFNEMQD